MATKKGTPFDPEGGVRGRQKRRVRNATDSYIRWNIAAGNPQIAPFISPEMIQLKREALLLGRLRRELKQACKELEK